MPIADVVTTSPSPAFYLAMSAYVAASVLYLSSLGPSPVWVARAARLVLLVAFVAHGVDIGWRGVEQVHPATSVRESLGFLSWVLVGGFAYFARREGLAVLGAFVAPVALIILAVARLSPSGEATAGFNSLGRLHIASATVGIAIFSLATGVSLIYLMQERNLKRKKFDGLLFRSSAALETLDKLSSRLVAIGFPIFTISMMLGGIWVSQRNQGLNRVEYPIAAITWLAFGALVVGRRLRGLQGRRAAHMTIVGFATSLLVLLMYFLRQTVAF